MGLKLINQLTNNTSPDIDEVTVTAVLSDGILKRVTWRKIKDLFAGYFAPIALVETISIQDINSNIAATTYVIEYYAAYPYAINQLKIIADAGTATAAVKINGTSVTGISAVSVSSSVATGTATAANSVAVGDKVTLVITSPSGLNNLQASIKTTRS